MRSDAVAVPPVARRVRRFVQPDSRKVHRVEKIAHPVTVFVDERRFVLAVFFI